MSSVKGFFNRQKIAETIQAYVPADAIVAPQVISKTQMKYTITFAESGTLPAVLILDYNTDGTTTIEKSRGKNKAYSEKLGDFVAEQTRVRLFDTDTLYFETISDDQFDTLVDYMTGCNVTLSSKVVGNGNKYTFSGEYGDTLHATRYNNGAILFQGCPSITFNNAIDILADIFPSNVILVGLTKYYKLDFDPDDLKSELYNVCPNLAGKITNDIENVMLPSIGLRRAIPNGLTDYSYLCFSVLRGLEGIIKTIFKDKGVIVPAKPGFANIMRYEEATRVASVDPSKVGLFTDVVERERVEKLYALLYQNRHRIFHYDTMTPIILSKEDAIDVLEETLKTINDAY
jgi:hypothetical protein